VREAERQATLRDGVGGGHEPSDDGVAPFSVQYLPRGQTLFRNGDGIGAPARGATRAFIAKTDGSHRDTDFEPYEVPALVQAGIAPRRVGLHAVLAEAALDVLALAFEDDEYPEPDVVGDRRAVGA